MIPKKIHYCWFGGKPLPQQAIKCIESWKKYCPDYEIVEWNENNFDIHSNKYIEQAFEAKKWAFVTDYVRLWTVFNFGGFYLDTDVELLKSLDDLLNYKAFVGIEKATLKAATGLGFGAEKGNIVIKEMMNDYLLASFKRDDGSIDITTCPERNSKVLENFGFRYEDIYQDLGDIIIFPSEYFCPKDFKTEKMKVTENTYSIHHYDASWKSWNIIIKNKIAKVIGKKNTKFLKQCLNKLK